MGRCSLALHGPAQCCSAKSAPLEGVGLQQSSRAASFTPVPCLLPAVIPSLGAAFWGSHCWVPSSAARPLGRVPGLFAGPSPCWGIRRTPTNVLEGYGTGSYHCSLLLVPTTVPCLGPILTTFFMTTAFILGRGDLGRQ